MAEPITMIYSDVWCRPEMFLNDINEKYCANYKEEDLIFKQELIHKGFKWLVYGR